MHQPPALAALDAARAALPDAVHVACFDTAFHATLPGGGVHLRGALRLARRRLGARRYGFHGLSHACAARRAADDPRPRSGRAAHRHVPPRGRCLVVRRLCAALGGHDDGVHAARGPRDGHPVGQARPGAVLWLIRRRASSPTGGGVALERASGILALSGSADIASWSPARRRGDAVLALGVYSHRLRAAIAAMTASLGGLDALVFTGGLASALPPCARWRSTGCGFSGSSLRPT